MDKITERIERQAGIPGLAALLAERLSPTDLQSLLLAVNRLRSARIRPADVLTGYAADRFVRPSPVSPVVMLRWDQIAFAHLPPGFEPIALAPVCPLGTSAAVAAIDPNWAVATIRNTEVVSDSTNVLALEAALRRRALLRANPKSAQPVHLAASHRLLRGQHYDSPLAFAHFGAFALCSAGRDRGTLRFELSTLDLHIRFYLETLHAFLLVRRSINDSVHQAGALAGAPDDETWRLYDRMAVFLDAMLLATVEGYQQPEAPSLHNLIAHSE